jgi:16S rRNA (cytosine1402-N4)-methyltransferase
MSFVHEPVLLREVVALVAPARPRLIVDCTLGGAGHAQALLAACPDATLLGLDRDVEALEAAREKLAPFAPRAKLVHARFGALEAVLAEHALAKPDVVFADLGVSSHQLDTAERGFSFRSAGPLDMRMDTTSGATALEIINRLDEAELANAIFRLGEERQSRRVARAIVQARPTTTKALADAVRSVVRPSRDGLDPATRTFQALRLLVNEELEELAAWLAAVPRVLADGGLALAISFHSLEDRAVKEAFRQAARDCVCPPRLPVCACGHKAELELVTSKPVRPASDELAQNPRAASAKLRAARRLPRAPS